MMNNTNDERCRNLLIALRKIIQAIDRHSSNLKKKFGLTGPQLILLQSISAHDKISVTQLSKNVSLSQATVTDITKRLENRDYITRTRNIDDKRKTKFSFIPCHRDIQNMFVTQRNRASFIALDFKAEIFGTLAQVLQQI